MDLSKLKLGQKIVLGAGILLVINLFIPWYRVSFMGVSASANAFDAGFLAWFGSLCGIAAAVIIALKVFANMKINAGPLKAEHIALILAALAVLFIFLRLVTETSSMFAGLFIGLVAAIALGYGAFLCLKQEGGSIQDFKSLGGSRTPPPPPSA